MSTTHELSLAQRRVLGAVGHDWRTTREITRIAGIDALGALQALYTRRYIARRRAQDGLLPLEWRREDEA